MIRWNIAVYSGLGAFCLSFIIGILSGNPFLAILFRAFIFGVIFAGMGAAGSFIINKFLPEIFNADYKQTAEATNSKNVDIVLPEENPVLGESLFEEKEKSGDEIIEDVDMAEELETAEEIEATDGIDEYEDVDADENINQYEEPEEQEEEVTAEEKLENGYDNIVVEEMDHDKNENIDVTDKTNQKNQLQEQAVQAPESAEASSEKIADEELDELPDMGVLENSFMVISSDEGSENNPLAGVKSQLSGKITKKEDPAVYAQAVRTIIKRDEEGPKKYGR